MPQVREQSSCHIHVYLQEPFHLVNEGLCKKMLAVLLFDRKDNKENEKVIEKLNKEYLAIRVFSETARLPRDLVESQLKGSEYGLITLTVLPVLAADIIKTHTEKW